jgi:3-oxoacyl-[acyl-carrier protein] reductase
MRKIVVITGGQGDIAQAIKERLEKENNFTVYSPSKYELDVTNVDSAKEYFARIKPDILVNNAGYIKPHNIEEFNYSDEIKAIDVNLTGSFICTGAALNVNKSTIIVNIGSSAGTKPRAEWSSYCAAKAGIIMATECWAHEGVKTICVSPGRTQSKMRLSLFPNESQETLMKASQFAEVVLKAINGEFEWGKNININLNNVVEYEK